MDSSQLLKGVLDLLVLAALYERDGYGYEIAKRIRHAGVADVGDASIYGTLRRLFDAGYLTSYMVPSDEGPSRKYYALAAAGREALVEGRRRWEELVDAVEGLFSEMHVPKEAS